MMMTLDESPARAQPLRGLVEGVTERLGRFPLAILQLIFRFSVASVARAVASAPRKQTEH